MTFNEQPEATPVLFVRLDGEYVRTTRDGFRDVNLKTVSAVAIPAGPPTPDRQRGARLLLLAAGATVAILTSLAILVFHGQLGVDLIAATRVALILAVATLTIFLWGLYRILIVNSDQKNILGAMFETGPLLGTEYRRLSSEHGHVSRALLILLHMGWIMPLTGVIIAIVGQAGNLRITGLATGTGLGALTVFIRSTVLPAHRETGKRLKEMLNEWLNDGRAEPKRRKKAR